MERDLTAGSVFKTVIYFSLPYLLSYFLQTLYVMADLFIVGQFGGVSSTTAVSMGSIVICVIPVHTFQSLAFIFRKTFSPFFDKRNMLKQF